MHAETDVPRSSSPKAAPSLPSSGDSAFATLSFASGEAAQQAKASASFRANPIHSGETLPKVSLMSSSLFCSTSKAGGENEWCWVTPKDSLNLESSPIGESTLMVASKFTYRGAFQKFQVQAPLTGPVCPSILGDHRRYQSGF